MSGVAGAVWVCVPTYNEAEHVEPLVTSALDALLRAGHDAHVLVIDDGSPDGTGEIADEMAAREPRVEVLHRPRKEGIGPAYVAGFRHALHRGAALVAEMDCDFSHDPEDLVRLVAAAQHADLVLGSRYAPGGAVEEWGPARRVLSLGGCLYARRGLGLDVRDLTGGFKCFRAEVLRALPLDRVRNRGYGFQIELTFEAARRGFRILEIPITYRERRAGRSKMSAGIAVEAAVGVLALRRTRPPGVVALEPEVAG